MTATFWIVAALFCAVAMSILFVPVWRHKRRGGPLVARRVVVATVLIVPLALGLYLYVSNWDPELAARVDAENACSTQLARHLESNPNDVARLAAAGRELHAARPLRRGQSGLSARLGADAAARRRAEARVRGVADPDRSRDAHRRSGPARRGSARVAARRPESALVWRARRARARARRRRSDALDAAA